MCIARKLMPFILIILIIGLGSLRATAATTNVTVTARPNWTSAFKVTYVNDQKIKIEWTVPPTANVSIRAKYTEYPESPAIGSEPTDGYLVFYGTGTVVYDTSMNLDLCWDRLYYKAWAYTDNLSLWSASIGQDFVEGRGVTLLSQTIMDVLAAVAVLGAVLVLSVLSFWKENYVLFMVTAGVSMMAGIYAPDLINGVYETTGYGIAVGFALLVYSFICAGFTFRLMFWSDD